MWKGRRGNEFYCFVCLHFNTLWLFPFRYLFFTFFVFTLRFLLMRLRFFFTIRHVFLLFAEALVFLQFDKFPSFSQKYCKIGKNLFHTEYIFYWEFTHSTMHAWWKKIYIANSCFLFYFFTFSSWIWIKEETENLFKSQQEMKIKIKNTHQRRRMVQGENKWNFLNIDCAPKSFFFSFTHKLIKWTHIRKKKVFWPFFLPSISYITVTLCHKVALKRIKWKYPVTGKEGMGCVLRAMNFDNQNLRFFFCFFPQYFFVPFQSSMCVLNVILMDHMKQEGEIQSHPFYLSPTFSSYSIGFTSELLVSTTFIALF